MADKCICAISARIGELCVCRSSNFMLYYVCIDGQVSLVRLVHLVRSVCLRMDNFGLFLHEKNGQTTNFRLHDEQMVKGSKKIAWASGFRFQFEMAAYV
jgi:hypothetical protein